MHLDQSISTNRSGPISVLCCPASGAVARDPGYPPEPRSNDIWSLSIHAEMVPPLPGFHRHKSCSVVLTGLIQRRLHLLYSTLPPVDHASGSPSPQCWGCSTLHRCCTPRFHRYQRPLAAGKSVSLAIRLPVVTLTPSTRSLYRKTPRRPLSCSTGSLGSAPPPFTVKTHSASSSNAATKYVSIAARKRTQRLTYILP